MRTCCSIRNVSAFAAATSFPWCRRIDSPIWSPTVNTGLSDVIGSWKIIAISAPRIARIVAPFARAKSVRVPSRRANSRLPPRIRPPPCSTRRITDSAVTDFPEPDSPTTATVSPRPTVNDTLRTASTVRSLDTNETDRPATTRAEDGLDTGSGDFSNDPGFPLSYQMSGNDVLNLLRLDDLALH